MARLRKRIEFSAGLLAGFLQFRKIGQPFFLQVEQRLCHFFQIVNLRPPLKAGGVRLLQFGLNVDQQVGLGRRSDFLF